jgi:excisionase family DNA binding protein
MTRPIDDLDDDETIGAAAAARILHCGVDQADDLAASGEIPATKFGRGWIFVRADLIAYIAERARTEAAQRRSKRKPAPASSMVLAAVPPKPSRRRTPPTLPNAPHLVSTT